MVTVEHLTKYYGDFLAVDDLSFEFGEAKVYGLLGPNGAGKSTTMNIMTGCLSATKGHVSIDGHDIFEEPEAAKRLIGYLPEQPPLYLNETPDEYLKFVGSAKGLKGEELKKQIDEVVLLTGIEEVRGRLMSSLSKGYKQRVGIAQALMGSPKVIILDEPTVGLDPIQIIEIRELIRKLGNGHTVILSSHILSEVQMVCEQVLIISGGRLVAFDSPDSLEKHMMTRGSVTIEAGAGLEKTRGIIESLEGGYELSSIKEEDGITTATIKTDDNDTRKLGGYLFNAFGKNNTVLYEMHAVKASLEDVFLELTDSDNGELPEGGDAVSGGPLNETLDETYGGEEEER